MTVVVWDGKTLATDKAASDGSAQWQTEKAWLFGESVLSGAGPLQSILTMREWYRAGALHNNFPQVQLSPQFCHFVIASKEGLIRYEQGPIAIDHKNDYCAFGEGRDFALGALAMGATSEQAVEVAINHSPYCGIGVRVYGIGD